MTEWYTHDIFHQKAAERIRPTSVVMDIGCGIRPQQYIDPDVLICIEPYDEYRSFLRRNLANSNAILLQSDAQTSLPAFPDRSVDTIFLIDVVEHMDKEIGLAVVRECERVAREQIIVFTPLGYMPQELHAGDVDGWNLSGGEWQAHRSGWHPEDFPGWDILACEALHFFDHRGNPIDPAYGGFYAIRNIPRVANEFNEFYANNVLDKGVSPLAFVTQNFPLLMDKVVRREVARSELRAGLRACQLTTELAIRDGATVSQVELAKRVAEETAQFRLAESRRLIDAVRGFAEQFKAYEPRRVEVEEKNARLDAEKIQLEAKQTQIDALKADLDGRQAKLVDVEARMDALTRLEAEHLRQSEELQFLRAEHQKLAAAKSESVFQHFRRALRSRLSK